MQLQTGVVDAVLILPRHRARRDRGLAAATAFDEDVVTLAADAVLELLDRSPVHPAALLMATVSAPLAEGGAVQTVAELTGLSGVGLHVQEHAGTTAAGGSALVAGAALVAAGVSPVIVVAADTRRDARGLAYGDAAVALLLDAEGTVGRLRHVGSAAEAFLDRWRHDNDETVQSGDDSLLRFGPGRAHSTALLGDTETELFAADSAGLERAGTLGCAALPAALLFSAAEGGPRSLVVSGGGVSHAFRFEPDRDIAAVAARARATLVGGIEGTPSRVSTPDGFDPYTSGPRAWRDRRQDLGLEGVRCTDCGLVLFPAPPACPVDGPDAKLEPYLLAHRGTVLTCTLDHLFPLGAPITMCVVDLDGGGRFYGQVAGGLGVAIGERVRLVPRLLHEGGGRPQYFWKVWPDSADDHSTDGEPPAHTTRED